jgi:Zn-dependent protease
VCYKSASSRLRRAPAHVCSSVENRRPTACAALALSVSASVASPLAAGTDPIQIGFVVAFLIISVSIHEVAHAVVANHFGDTTAKDLGRITLNPLAHIGLYESIVMPIVTLVASGGRFAFGGAKPVPVNYHRLRHPLRDMMLVALAGPVTNVILAAVFITAWKAAFHFGDYESGELLPDVLLMSGYTNLVLAAFNMLPIPPLDGSRMMAWLLPATVRDSYIQLERFGLLLVLGVWFLVPGVRELVIGLVGQLFRFVDMATGGAW